MSFPHRTRFKSDASSRPVPSSSINAVRSYPTACGATVELTEKSLHHLEAHPDVFDILPEAIAKIRFPLGQPFVEIEVDMGRVIGTSGCVPTTRIHPNDKAQFALRKGRTSPSRVITGVSGVSTQKAVVIAKKIHGNRYSLVTSWIGSLAKKEPWDPAIRSPQQARECLDFWCNHALIHDPEMMGQVFESSWNQVAELRTDFS